MIIPGEPRHSPALLARRAFDTWGKGSCKYPATATPTQSPSPVPLRLEDTKNPSASTPSGAFVRSVAAIQVRTLSVSLNGSSAERPRPGCRIQSRHDHHFSMESWQHSACARIGTNVKIARIIIPRTRRQVSVIVAKTIRPAATVQILMQPNAVPVELKRKLLASRYM